MRRWMAGGRTSASGPKLLRQVVVPARRPSPGVSRHHLSQDSCQCHAICHLMKTVESILRTNIRVTLTIHLHRTSDHKWRNQPFSTKTEATSVESAASLVLTILSPVVEWFNLDIDTIHLEVPTQGKSKRYNSHRKLHTSPGTGSWKCRVAN